jgi:acyl CoA:acetate/3-ketoacid CoA transferase
VCGGAEVLYITERCGISLEAVSLTVIEIAPGVDLNRDILATLTFLFV